MLQSHQSLLSQYSIKPINNILLLDTSIVISDVCKINDCRKINDFKDQVFGGYKLSQASMALEKAILEDKIEPALHWSAQLLLSGVINPLWEKLLNIATKMINIHNPTLPEFLYNKTQQWIHIVDNCKYNKDNILLLRNNSAIRLLIAEMVCILCLSKKRKLNILPKIKKEEFIIDTFRAKLEAPSNIFSNSIEGDPTEILIAANELAYNLINTNCLKALYWLNWIIEWERINSKKYGKYECGIRIVEGVDGKYYRDVVWLIWSIINNIKDTHNQIIYLYKMYRNKFTPGSKHKKILLIIWAILYMTEPIDNSIVLVTKPELLFKSLLGYDNLIASLKIQEVHNVSDELSKKLTNVIIENNYQTPTKPLQYTTPKINTTTLSKNEKLNELYKLDRIMYA